MAQLSPRWTHPRTADEELIRAYVRQHIEPWSHKMSPTSFARDTDLGRTWLGRFLEGRGALGLTDCRKLASGLGMDLWSFLVAAGVLDDRSDLLASSADEGTAAPSVDDRAMYSVRALPAGLPPSGDPDLVFLASTSSYVLQTQWWRGKKEGRTEADALLFECAAHRPTLRAAAEGVDFTPCCDLARISFVEYVPRYSVLHEKVRGRGLREKARLLREA